MREKDALQADGRMPAAPLPDRPRMPGVQEGMQCPMRGIPAGAGLRQGQWLPLLPRRMPEAAMPALEVPPLPRQGPGGISSLRSEARKGPRLSEERRTGIAALVAPLARKQGQSLRQIHLAHAEELGVSLQTLYNCVDRKWLPGIINLDLRKKTKYKPRPKEKAKSGTVDPAILQMQRRCAQ